MTYLENFIELLPFWKRISPSLFSTIFGLLNFLPYNFVASFLSIYLNFEWGLGVELDNIFNQLMLKPKKLEPFSSGEFYLLNKQPPTIFKGEQPWTLFLYWLAVWPDWAIFRHLGDFLKPLAQFFFKKRAQKFGSILGDFLKRVKILIFIVISTLASKEK